MQNKVWSLRFWTRDLSGVFTPAVHIDCKIKLETEQPYRPSCISMPAAVHLITAWSLLLTLRKEATWFIAYLTPTSTCMKPGSSSLGVLRPSSRTRHKQARSSSRGTIQQPVRYAAVSHCCCSNTAHYLCENMTPSTKPEVPNTATPS